MDKSIGRRIKVDFIILYGFLYDFVSTSSKLNFGNKRNLYYYNMIPRTGKIKSFKNFRMEKGGYHLDLNLRVGKIKRFKNFRNEKGGYYLNLNLRAGKIKRRKSFRNKKGGYYLNLDLRLGNNITTYLRVLGAKRTVLSKIQIQLKWAR